DKLQTTQDARRRPRQLTRSNNFDMNPIQKEDDAHVRKHSTYRGDDRELGPGSEDLPDDFRHEKNHPWNDRLKGRVQQNPRPFERRRHRPRLAAAPAGFSLGPRSFRLRRRRRSGRARSAETILPGLPYSPESKPRAVRRPARPRSRRQPVGSLAERHGERARRLR